MYKGFIVTATSKSAEDKDARKYIEIFLKERVLYIAKRTRMFPPTAKMQQMQ
jgi:hypothetical protein